MLSFLAALDIAAVCTATVDSLGTALTLSTKVMMKKEQGEFCYSFDKVISLHLSTNVNEIIRTVLNFFFLRKEKSPLILRFVSMYVLTIGECEDSC